MTVNEQQRRKRIDKRRADMPKVYRATYDKAMTGKSLRSAINAFCLECVMWQREEVRLCTSVACPLWLYRPYQDATVNSQGISKNASEGSDFAPDSTNAPSKESGQDKVQPAIEKPSGS